MSTYEETLEVAGQINRAPGGYQTRTSAARPGVIEVKGGKLKGWETMTVAVAKIRFGLVVAPEPTVVVVAPTPEPTPAPPAPPGRAPARAVPQPAPPWVPRQGAT